MTSEEVDDRSRSLFDDIAKLIERDSGAMRGAGISEAVVGAVVLGALCTSVGANVARQLAGIGLPPERLLDAIMSAVPIVVKQYIVSAADAVGLDATVSMDDGQPKVTLQ